MRSEIFDAIEQERDYQDARWGTEFDDLNTANDWSSYINRYSSNACEMGVGTDDFEEQMTKVAALAVAAIECSRRNGGPAPRHYDPKPCQVRREAVDRAFDDGVNYEPTGLTFQDLPQVDGLTLGDLTDEEFREYRILDGGNYKIENPVGLYIRPGGSTHRVVDREGNVHCVAFPNNGQTVLIWKNRSGKAPVAF